MPSKKRDTWNCPFCWKQCELGKMGCDDPSECTEEKNIHFEVYQRMNAAEEVTDIGISKIANAEV